MKYVRALVTALVIVIAVTSFAGCNTLRGAGRDIQQGGRALEDAATR